MHRQCFSSGTAADGHTPYKARPSQNWPKITTNDHVHQIFITSCAWFHGQNPSKNGFPWSRRCCSRWCRVQDELQSIHRRGRTRGKIGTTSDAAKIFELFKMLARGQPRAAHVVKTCNTRETHVIIRVLLVIKTWGNAVRREMLGSVTGRARSSDGCYALVSR